MKKFKFTNNLTGWVVFAIATAVYILTIEPTASFWDCGEFIATAFKLEVGHPPGNPLFQMLGNIATLFAGGNTSLIPVTVNIYSALCSGFTILFLFWSITHLARKITGNKKEFSTGQLIAIMGSGVVGALAYTFSDSFWFSAVEAEVYASSSFFTAIVFWAILKWEDVADERYANRWLVLIAYLMGLSIGVHLLNLLAIPALSLVYYFRKYPVTPKGLFTSIGISIVILLAVLYGIIQGLFKVASLFERLFVNGFGLPFSSGWIFYTVALIAFVVWGIWFTSKKGKVLWNTVLLCFAVILLGYSSYVMVIIRSNANTPLNENNPSNVFNLLSYLNREQYGDRPLIFGQYYDAPIRESKNGSAIWGEKDGKYVEISHKPEYTYDSQFTTLFPRMYSRESSHIGAYKVWGNIKGTPVLTTNERGEQETLYKPTFGENLRFFFKYQVGFMYLRYFMWNFSGRQNDIQGSGSPLQGNWITGINFIDENFLNLGPQDNLPPSLKNNRGRNTYFMLPLLLGLIGMFYHMQRHRKDFWVVMVLFFLTGLAIVLYLNQTPYQPRERDYAYVGSFYAFAIWIGLGVIALIDWLSKRKQNVAVGILVSMITLVLVPGLMAQQNWDDHDRSGRYTCRDFACNYLNSCEKDAIIFTNGDNDTFPLWYAQEVENVRPDIRVVNLNYLGADWYIEQMQRKVYDSDALPFSMNKFKYQSGTRDALYVIDRLGGEYCDLKEAMQFVASDRIDTKTLPNAQGERIDYLPAKNFSLKINSSQILTQKVVSPKYAGSIIPEMKWELTDARQKDKKVYKNMIFKNDMMVLDLMAHNDWKRPVYFAITVGDDNYLGFEKYFRLDGFAYRIVPIETDRPDGQPGFIDTDILYDNLMNKFKWGNVSNSKVYLDENNMRMLSNFRNTFARLAEQLNNENKKDSAAKVLDKCQSVMPPNQVPLNFYALSLLEQYYRAGQITKANSMAEQIFNNTNLDLKYYARIRGKSGQSIAHEKQIGLYALNNLAHLAENYNQKDLAEKYGNALQSFMGMVNQDEQ
jgi:hypothetical protein